MVHLNYNNTTARNPKPTARRDRKAVRIPHSHSYDQQSTNTIKMKTTPEHDERIARITFSSVYPHYVTKVESKGRTKEELHEVIQWLTGFDDKKRQELIDRKVTFATFFDEARLNPHAGLITGVICGYRVEDIGNPLTRQIRYLDKLIDELAKGKKMDKILRNP